MNFQNEVCVNKSMSSGQQQAINLVIVAGNLLKISVNL